jgi:hypothetical protein
VAALVQFLGLVRWPFAVPHLARLAGDPATRDAVEVVFQTLNRYLGVAAPLFVLGSLEFVGPFEVRGWKLAGTLIPFAYIGWSVWLLTLGIGLLVTA